jgi:riboflavin kinase, archaea type
VAEPPSSRLRAEQFELLRLLAQMGAIQSPVELTSREVGGKLGVSQQAADRYLVALERAGLLTRQLGGRRQRLTLTAAGVAVLRTEHHLLRRLFEGPARSTIAGAVASGLGEGRYYLSQPGYVVQFQERLGYAPFPGTLNIRVGPKELLTVGTVKHWAGIRIDGFQASGRTFGGATCFPAHLRGQASHLIVPDRTHYQDVVELVAPVSLRETLRLKDGDQVEVGVEEA